MRAFVTGGTGLLGRPLVETLHEDGWEVTVLTRDPVRAKDLEARGVQIVEGDVTRPRFNASLARADVVFHVAGLYEVGLREFRRMIDVNVTGTPNVRAPARGRLPRLPRGFGVNTWTHAADIARGHVLAATRGNPGELYILGDRVLPVVEFYRKAAEAAGVKPPNPSVRLGLARLAARFSEAKARLAGRTPVLSRAALDFARVDIVVDASKARRDLEWTPAPLEDRIRETMAWDVDTYRIRQAPLPVKPNTASG